MTRRALRPSVAELAPALASAALFALAFPPIPLLLPVFACLVPLGVALARLADRPDADPRRAVRTGFWFGMLAYGATLYWIALALAIFTKLAFLGYIGALLVLAVVTGATGGALYAVRRATRLPMAVVLPVVWTASELLLNYLPDLGFPWLPLGLATTQLPHLAQLADVSGVRGVSFWIAAVNGLAVDAWLLRAERRAVVRRAVVAAALVALAAAYGAWRLRTTPLRPVAPVAVVQPNIPQDEKWQGTNRDRIVGITAGLTRRHLERHDAALVVWPEVALPGFFVQHPDWRDTLQALAAVKRTPILFGVLDVVYQSAQDFEYYNSAMLADSLGRIGQHRAYYKGWLVPIVERVPFVNPRWFADLKYFGGFGRGTDPVVYALPFGRFGVLICYESIFPQLSRTYRRRGADLIVNITNDAWFGRTLAPYQHHAHMVLRAIENRVGIVRSANTGISSYIDPLGRVHGATELYVSATRTYRAETTDVRTLYVALGDWVGLLSAGATVLVLGWYGAMRRLRRRRPGSGYDPLTPSTDS